jgi:glutamine amidotransferase
MIAVVDYGMGNLGSVYNMLKRIGVESAITGSAEHISKADKIILPGVGAFDAAMQRITDSGLRQVLSQKASIEKVPVLGICLGMQLLTRGSEEGIIEGLNWIPAKTIRFSSNEQNFKIPHMGWNKTHITRNHSLTNTLLEGSKFYFVHSYYVQADDEKYVLARTEYGQPFDSIITNGDNVFGAQFHPEKSHKFGMKFLENFAKL